jgi:ketosteroid isomerase-like protein
MKTAAIAFALTLALPLAAKAQQTKPAPAPVPAAIKALQAEVAAAERAFADTMKRRDHAGFATFVADDAVFFGDGAQHGKAEIVEAWRGMYQGANAPFSWDPDTVEVLSSGTLAHSSGPIRDPAGKVTGRFNSIWRKDAGGWHVVFDKGQPVCNCQAKPQG